MPLALQNTMTAWLQLLVAVNTFVVECLQHCNVRRWWVKPHLHPDVRARYGAFSTLFQYFKLNDHEEFYKFVGMTVQQFQQILELLQPSLTKTSRREALCPELRLAAVLK